MARQQPVNSTESGFEPGLPKRGMTFGPKRLLPFEVENGRIHFELMRMDCDKFPPGTCGTSTRGCATCCVPPPPPMTPEVARILLDILMRSCIEESAIQF